MKVTILACTMLAIMFHAQAAPVLAPDSFRLTVEELVQTSGCRVVNLKVETSSGQMLEVRGERGAKQGVGLAPARTGKMFEGQVTITSMIGEGNAVCHTAAVVCGRAGGAEAYLPASFNIAPGTRLESVVAVTATNGIYKLNYPLVIGSRDGEVLRLVVGTWNWERASVK